MTGATRCDAVTDEMVWKVSGPEVLDRPNGGGKAGFELSAAELPDDHGTAELGPLTGDAAGGLLEMAATLKGRPVCAGSPDLGCCVVLRDVSMVGLVGR